MHMNLTANTWDQLVEIRRLQTFRRRDLLLSSGNYSSETGGRQTDKNAGLLSLASQAKSYHNTQIRKLFLCH